MTDDQIVGAVNQWVQSVVIDLNLCPFAKRELVKNRVRFVVSAARDEAHLLEQLQYELMLLNVQPEVETTLLIHPHVLGQFAAYNDFLYRADDLLGHLEMEGVYQIASFHPDYQFGGTHATDAENYTNRSPYPLLHILRENSLTRAIDHYADTDQIPVRNVELMNQMGATQMAALLQACFRPVTTSQVKK